VLTATPASPDRASSQDARPTPQERKSAGKALRAAVPLDAHAESPGTTRLRDPLTLLEEQAVNRLPELRPIRYGRMLQSPFAYYRGAARVMAADLAGAPRSGLIVQMCGDAHAANFGLYGSPERRLVFDTNDFDETLPGPFEHDVKRLVASLEIAGRHNGLSRKQRRSLTVAAGARYRTAMAGFAAARDIEVWYSRIDAEEFREQLAPRLDAGTRKRLTRALERARTRDTLQAFGKLTEVVDGRLRIRAEAPLLVPLRDVLPDVEEKDLEAAFRCSPTAASCSSATPSSTWPARSSGWAVSAPAAGSSCSSGATRTTRCCCRSRRRRRRCTRSSWGAAATPTRGSVS
jgi:hypothetical protein